MTTSKLLLSAFAATLTVAASLHAAIAPAENLLPADTIAFFTVPDCNALRAASKVSPQLMFWNDPAMKAFHDKFMAKLTEQYLAPLEKDLGLKVEDFADLPQGQFTLAANMNGSNGHDDLPPGIVLLLDAKDKSAQLKTNLTALTKKMTENGRTLRTEKIRGLAFTVVTLSSNDLAGIFGARTPVSEISKEQKPEKPVDIYFTQYESLLVVANSAKLADAVAAHLTGGSAPALADDAVFAADKLSQFRNSPTYYGWFNGKMFFNLISQIPEDDTSAGNGLMPKFSAAKIIAATGLGGLKSASFTMNEAREGSTAIVRLNAPADTRAGLMKILALPARDASAPDFVPADVIKFSRIRLDGKQTWADLQKLISGINPQMLAMVNSAIDLANTSAQEKNPSFDLRNDLFGNLGDDLVVWSKPAVGDSIKALSNPPSLALVATPNADKLINAVKTIGGLGAPQTVAPREFHGHKIHSLILRAQRGPGGTSVAQPPLLMSAAGGYVAFTSDPGILEDFLRSTEGAGKSLRENAALTEAATHVGGTGNGLFTYQNQRETMRITFKLFKNAATADPTLNLLPANIREWADFTLLPEYEKVAKYFYLSVVSGGGNGEGINLKVFTPRPPTLN